MMHFCYKKFVLFVHYVSEVNMLIGS